MGTDRKIEIYHAMIISPEDGSIQYEGTGFSHDEAWKDVYRVIREDREDEIGSMHPGFVEISRWIKDIYDDEPLVPNISKITVETNMLVTIGEWDK